ncbi:hypothetical protein SLS55_001211 [Diplodia seriata]|uniref:Endoplasmic reticulum junction formation protein lunapark n=3 Tax=Diplodia TaxID=66735 RepID=A0A0G2GX07_9PEZI|nr:putative protein of unknown function DUF2296 [Diplodia seriata]
MVSLWPWRDDNSAAGFEKTLSALSTKITKASARGDRLRQNSRRSKVMWTLYTTFAYILAALILTLITGWRNWGPIEYTGMAGGPLVIYGVRQALAAYFNYRINNTQSYLDNLYKERDATIEKLKDATKYNSTQQLLEKYGTPKPSPKKEPSTPDQRRPSGDSRPSSAAGAHPGRTGFAPPPTANIPRNNVATPSEGGSSRPVTPGEGQHFPPPFPTGQQQPPFPPGPQAGGPVAGVTDAEFAPNAFPAQYAPESPRGPQWYDRILDVLLGEDETQPKNRFVLICGHCRLVNGQAPPGTKSLEDLGKWKCMGCGGWNGQENEAQKLVAQIQRQEKRAGTSKKPSDDDAAPGKPIWKVTDASPENSADESASEEAPPSRSTRSKTKGKKL